MARVLGVWVWVPARRSPGRRAMLAAPSPHPHVGAGGHQEATRSHQVLDEADPLPHALVQEGVPEALAARREPAPGEGELAGGLGAGGQVVVRARRPSAGRRPRPCPAPGCGARGRSRRRGPRWTRRGSTSGTGWSARSATTLGGLGQLGDRSGVVVELLVGGRRHEIRAPRRRSAWRTTRGSRSPGRRHRAVRRGSANIPTRSSQATPCRSSSSTSARRATTPPCEWAMRSTGTPGAAADHLLDEVGQPPAGDPEVVLGLGGAVVGDRDLREPVGGVGHPPTRVAEAQHIGSGVPELVGAHLVDAGARAVGTEAGDQHGDPSVRRRWDGIARRRARSVGGRSGALPGLEHRPPAVDERGREGEALCVVVEGAQQLGPAVLQPGSDGTGGAPRPLAAGVRRRR